jgi:hypothetical protein
METFLTKLIEWAWDIAERYIFFWVIVREYEGGVVLLLGKYHYDLKQGWNWKCPFVHESLTCLIKPETIETRPFTVTTKDHKTISMSLIGCYEVVDARCWLLQANDAGTNIIHHLIMVGTDYIAEYNWEDLKDKKSYTPIKNKLNKIIDYTGAEFTMIGYGSISQTTPISLINN